MLLFFRILTEIIIIIVVLFMILIILLICSQIKFTINTFEYYYFREKSQVKYNSKIGLYLFGKIKLISIKINNDKIDNKNSKHYEINRLLKNKFISKKIESVKISKHNQKSTQIRDIINLIKKLTTKMNIEKMNFKLMVDTENVVLTSYLIGVISAIVPNILRKNIKKYNSNNYKFNIMPIYKNENSIYFNFQSIFNIKVVHIINMLKI